MFIICITLLLLVNCAPVYPFYSHNHDDYYDEPFHDDPDPDDHLVPGSLSHSHYGTYTFQLPEDNDRPPADILFTTTQSPPLPQSPPSLPLTPLSPDNRVFVLKTPELPQTLVENKSQQPQPQPQQQLLKPPLPKPDNYSSVVNVSFDYFDNETEGQVELEDQYGEYEAEREADEDTAEDDDNKVEQVPEFEDEVEEEEEEEEEEDGSGFSQQKQTDDVMWQVEEENNLIKSDDGFLNDSISESDENDLEKSENAEDEMIQVQNLTTGSQLSSFQPQKDNSSAPVEQMKEAITDGELFENENDEDDEKYENKEDYESEEMENDRHENEKYENDENEDEDYDEIENSNNDDEDDDDEELESSYKMANETEYDILNDFDVFSEPIQLFLNLSKSIQPLDQPLQQMQNLSIDVDKILKPIEQHLNLTEVGEPVKSNQLQHSISELNKPSFNNSQTQHLNSTNANEFLTPTYQQNSTEQVNLTALLDKNTTLQHLNQNSSLPFIELSEPKLLQNLSLSKGDNLTSTTTVPLQNQSLSPVIEPTFNITTTHTPQNQTNEEITYSVESPLPMPQLQNGSTVDISLPDQVQQQQHQLLLNTSTVVTGDLWNTTLKLSSGNLSIAANESLPQAIQKAKQQQTLLNLTTVSNENQTESPAQQIHKQIASSLLSSSSDIDSKQQQGQMENETIAAVVANTTVTKLPSISSESQIQNSSELFISTTTSTTSTPLPAELIQNSNGQNLTVNSAKEEHPLLPILQEQQQQKPLPPVSQSVKNAEFETPKKKQQIQYLPAIVVTSSPMVISKYAKQPFLNLSATISDLGDDNDDDDDAKNDRHHLKRPHLPQIINSRVPCFSQRDCQSVTLFGLKANRCDRVTGTCVGQYFNRPKTLSPKNGALHFQTQIELPISAVAITTTTTTISTTEIPPTEMVVPTQTPTQSSSSSSDEGPIETSSSSSSFTSTSAPAPVTALDSTAAAAKRGIFNFISLLFS